MENVAQLIRYSVAVPPMISLALREMNVETDQRGPKRHLLELRQPFRAKVLAEDALVIAVADWCVRKRD